MNDRFLSLVGKYQEDVYSSSSKVRPQSFYETERIEGPLTASTDFSSKITTGLLEAFPSPTAEHLCVGDFLYKKTPNALKQSGVRNQIHHHQIHPLFFSSRLYHEVSDTIEKVFVQLNSFLRGLSSV